MCLVVAGTAREQASFQIILVYVKNVNVYNKIFYILF